ncbi:response regulator transcription factor [Saccharothrix violaceirubra]|uniref:DNA-binding response OmpR family regulator n=1 Tax=Saccharothrix violaceirubra TaxID=413306 RepID=A0A7W7T8C0_9PSEU|nr:response regulator transcription factor [Saccharothrix violaceirubra]MBB4968395.1 DNA-binding response OmpR family regulator [Saccharothrix violaceirubra]
MSAVLVVEDEPDIAMVLRVLLTRAGHEVLLAGDGKSGLRLVHETRPELVLLDIGLPAMDGWTVLERIRDVSDVPVMLLTAHGQETDKVRGLRGGADDYMTKPFSNGELLARIEALLRRAGQQQAPAEPADQVYDDGTVRVDHMSRRVYLEGAEVTLNATDYGLLTMFTRHRGSVLSAGQLLATVWKDHSGLGTERVKFAILRLRRRLGWTADTSPIKAIPKMGYRYDPPRR